MFRSMPQSHLNRKPERSSGGTSRTACATMPPVTPRPRISSFGSVSETCCVSMSPGITQTTRMVKMTTRLLITGAHAVGPKMCFAFSTAESSANTP